MAHPPLILSILLILISTLINPSNSLSLDYYKKTCPRFEEILKNTVVDKQMKQPTTAGGTTRLFFHDCFVDGCDASVLISSNAFNKAERDHDINLSLPGDAFDVVVRAKSELELDCPGVVSCSDILAVATRNLISMVGGPYYNVMLGRKDGLISKASRVEGNLPRGNMSISEILAIFANKGFNTQEMVALSGAHTIGFSHCKEFTSRIYNYSKLSAYDPVMNPRYAEGLRKACANYVKDPTMAAFNDIMTPGKFDNMYFQNLPRGLGLLAFDQGLYADARTRPYVELYSKNEQAFFEAFVKAMEKLSLYGVKVGRLHGEVRRRCDQFNSLST
ncbi:peroxidase 31-like [Tasmannia lanceolata]|uniref:peroxidase 31-like n=1 Tax=Tasmannia lanceolata TaxID=3420 RepID=UPI004064BBA5